MLGMTFLSNHVIESYPIPHGPGPPHRPHIPGASAALDFDAPAPTATTLNARFVCVEPHSGHFTFASLSAMLFARWSNDFWQLLQVY